MREEFENKVYELVGEARVPFDDGVHHEASLFDFCMDGNEDDEGYILSEKVIKFFDSQLRLVFVVIEKTLIRDIDADDVCDVDDLRDLQYMKLEKLRLKYCKMRPYEDESNYEFKICPECGRSSTVYKILNKCSACIAKKILASSNSELKVKTKK